LSSAPGKHRGLERLLVGPVGHYCLSHAFCPVVKDSTDRPIGANASPTGERREMPSRHAADCVRNRVTTDHDTRVP
jgi:hypothetical protein